MVSDCQKLRLSAKQPHFLHSFTKCFIRLQVQFCSNSHCKVYVLSCLVVPQDGSVIIANRKRCIFVANCWWKTANTNKQTKIITKDISGPVTHNLDSSWGELQCKPINKLYEVWAIAPSCDWISSMFGWWLKQEGVSGWSQHVVRGLVEVQVPWHRKGDDLVLKPETYIFVMFANFTDMQKWTLYLM